MTSPPFDPTRDPLAPLAAWMTLWRTSFIDLPLAMAWESDLLARRCHAEGASHIAALGACRTPAEAMEEGTRIAECTLRNLGETAEVLAGETQRALIGEG